MSDSQNLNPNWNGIGIKIQDIKKSIRHRIMGNSQNLNPNWNGVGIKIHDIKK